jgi:hypothetical protein
MHHAAEIMKLVANKPLLATEETTQYTVKLAYQKI